ncbi:MAG TPA: prepilin-type N-terminal cleavage/methylation domain-containing protein [bacterium]|nr:prepilin-type N-terminal cleavage/methylation domain-containing protein [bacterium]
MKKSKVGNGFTLIEILISMFILVIIFGLITVLFARASTVRKIVVAHSEIQQTLSQMMDTIVHGKRGGWGLADASCIRSITLNEGTYDDTCVSYNTLVAYNETQNETMIVRIASERELTDEGDNTKTLWVGWYSDPLPPDASNFYNEEALIDINNKVELVVNNDEPENTRYSNFTYYDSRGRDIITGELDTETTLVKIVLSAKSKDPGLKNKAPVVLQTAIKLKNALPF